MSHPGRNKTERAILDGIGCGDYAPPTAGVANQRAIKAMLERGIIQHTGDKVVCKDRFGIVTVPEYDMSIPTHMAWCDYWSEQPCEHGVPDIEDCAVCDAEMRGEA